LRRQYPEPENVSYVDGGTLSFTLAGMVEENDSLIVIDAAQLKQEPGTIACFIGEEMDNFLGKGKRSVHEVGLLDLLDMARLTERLPPRRALVAIQPETIDWGEQPSVAVSQAIPTAVEQIIKLMERWSDKHALESRQ
jgi:hydrogenase maturation protease